MLTLREQDVTKKRELVFESIHSTVLQDNISWGTINPMKLI